MTRKFSAWKFRGRSRPDGFAFEAAKCLSCSGLWMLNKYGSFGYYRYERHAAYLRTKKPLDICSAHDNVNQISKKASIHDFLCIDVSAIPCFAKNSRLTLANLLLARIRGPKKTKTHGTTVRSAPTPPKKLEAPAKVICVNIASVTRGNTPPSMFRQKDCAANAELAYRWYVSAR